MNSWDKGDLPELWILPQSLYRGSEFVRLCKDMGVLVVYVPRDEDKHIYRHLAGVEIRGYRLHPGVTLLVSEHIFLSTRVKGVRP